ncbi:MAG: hypothetical protein JWP27_2336 [Flaviaesturariibacter sp.]|nr:hypothetical protein [Flaviaesturariibacter sp.]
MNHGVRSEHKDWNAKGCPLQLLFPAQATSQLIALLKS